ncbi:MAG: hypothetical protein ABWY36_03860 [Leifsonia sp.]
MTDGAGQHTGHGDDPQDGRYGEQPQAVPQYGQPQAAPHYGQPPAPPQYGEYAPPAYGQYQQPSWAQPGQDGYQAPYGGGLPAWTPPPKPGIIPLRPLSFGALLAAPFQLLKRNPKATFGSALLIQGIVAVASVAIVVPITFLLVSRIENASVQDQDAITAGAVGLSIVLALVLVAVSLLASALLQGVIVLEAARATLGEKLRMGALWRQVWRRILPLTGWLLLLTAATVIGIGIVVVIAVLLFSLGPAYLGIGVAFSVLASLGLVVLGVWLYTKTLFVPCAIVLERNGLWTSIRRSWLLVRGAFWKTFGINLLITVIVNVITQIITTPISLVLGFGSTLIDPNQAGDQVAVLIATNGIVLLLTVIIGAIASVLQSGTIAFLYIDRRMRTEALDIELERAAEAREAGREAADPYLARPQVATTV